MTEWPRWPLMWMLALAVYVTSKGLTWRAAHRINAPAWRHAAYLLACRRQSRAKPAREAHWSWPWRHRTIISFAAVVVPLGLLFHRPFVLGIFIPFMHATGALP